MPAYVWLSIGVLLGAHIPSFTSWLMTRRERIYYTRRVPHMTIDEIIDEALGRPAAGDAQVPRPRNRHENRTGAE